VLRHSQSDTTNEQVQDWSERFAETGNAEFFAAAIDELSDRDGRALIGLVGSRDLPGVALRRAQSILRWDRRPSMWSHAFLLTGASDLREVALHSRAGHFPEPARNAITPATLEHYAKAHVDANVALLSVHMDDKEADRIVARATANQNLERLRYDFFETLGHWYAFLWTRGTPNPLEQGVPHYASSMVEYCFEEIQLDLTPGASDRNSAPEHLWNGARWWSKEFGEFKRPISGRYVVRDRNCSVLGPKED
jgi:hypothetical protein